MRLVRCIVYAADMRRLILSLVLSSGLLPLSSGLLPLSSGLLPLSSGLLAQDAKRIEGIGTFYHQRDGFSGVIAVAHGDSIVFGKGYGLASREGQIAAALDTRFDIGSITKQFTAAAILLLQQDGKLHTSDTLGSHLPAIPDAWKPITLRQLLSHTSGIPDYASQLPDTLKYADHPAINLLAPVLSQPLDAKPGAVYEYSNTNYLLLALVIEQASGQPYCDFLSKRILVPQGLTHTSCVSRTGTIPQHATGYLATAGNPVEASPVVLSSWYGAGNLVSTAPDLIRWSVALHTGRVLRPESLQEMTTPVLSNYGYGLDIGEDDGHAWFSHTGKVPGFDSFLEYILDSQTTVVVLSNLGTFGGDGRSTGTFALINDLLNLLVEPKPTLLAEGTEVAVPATTLDQYVGRYAAPETGKDLTQQAILTIRRDGAHLLATLQQGGNNQPEVPLRAQNPTDFFIAGDEAEIDFDPQEGGHLTLTLFRIPSATRFDRITPEAAKSAPK